MKKLYIIILTALLLAGCDIATAEEQRKWEAVIAHISDSTHMTKEECNDWHKERGWDSCGYNFVIEPDGTVYEGRGINKVGAHVKGFNSKFLGICFVSEDKATEEQLQSFVKLLNQYDIILPIYPHALFNSKKVCGLEVIKQLKGRVKLVVG